MTRPLTERQAHTLRAIEAHIRRRGFAPSLGELCKEAKISLPRARILLHALEAKGWIARERQDGRALSRAITILRPAPAAGFTPTT